tara:strand:- start:398 stop:634 length:237 start_codon:yes stop_codon:yes gene_type:complete
MGGVMKVDAKQGRLVIRPRGAAEPVTVLVDKAVTIIRNGQPASLSDLQMRDMVMISIAPKNGENMPRALRIMARSSRN